MTQILQPREVPLGGYRAMTVRRVLPHRQRGFIGAWCFLDHYGPERTAMDVAPHPHTGLQTVSWLFSGEIEHRDALGSVQRVRPGELNLMTAGAGICHSEQSTSPDDVLHGVQLWVALPEATYLGDRAFVHYEPEPVSLDGGSKLTMLMGELPGTARSEIEGHTPLMGAEIVLGPWARVQLPLESGFEHGVLVDAGEVYLEGELDAPVQVAPRELAHLDPGLKRLTLSAGGDGARLMLIGGVPFEEEVIMWWNFIGRSHDEVVAYREEWNSGAERFGAVEGYEPLDPSGLQRIPAPGMPGLRLLPTVRRGRRSSVK